MISGKTVLLIEDNPDDAFLIDRTLRSYMRAHEYELVRASSMSEAEAYIDENREEIELILLDLDLPDTDDGRDSFAHVKRTAADVPVVIMTGADDNGMALEIIDKGAEDFTNKKLLRERPDLIRRSIEFAIRRHRLLSETRKKAEDLAERQDTLLSWLGGDYSVRK